MTLNHASSKWILSILLSLLILLQPAYQPPADSAAALTFQRLWPITDNNTKTSGTVIDYKGGIHMAISAHTVVNGTWPAYYAYCPSGCNDKAHWTVTTVGNLGSMFGEYTRIDVDPSGRPRMMWYQQTSISSDGVYQYAECNSGCANAQNWRIATLNSTAIGPDNSRYFALDQQGRPRYVYTDTDSQHRGTFFVSCNTSCTSKTNWREVKIDDAYLLYDFDLAFDTNGKIALAFRSAVSYPDTFVYAECAAACDNPASWVGTTLVNPIGSGAAFSLRLDSQGRPRVAYYSGYLGTNDPENNLLYYGWCNTGCAQVDSWALYPLGLPAGHGEDVDLAIGAQDRPHLAYYINDIDGSMYGLGYAACSAGCESGAPTWQAQMVESGSDLDASNPVPLQPGCTLSAWLDNGIDPSIAVDSAGQPRISYTAVHYQSGNYTCNIHEDIRLVRFALSGTNLPPITGKYKAYLPTLKR